MEKQITAALALSVLAAAVAVATFSTFGSIYVSRHNSNYGNSPVTALYPISGTMPTHVTH